MADFGFWLVGRALSGPELPVSVSSAQSLKPSVTTPWPCRVGQRSGTLRSSLSLGLWNLLLIYRRSLGRVEHSYKTCLISHMIGERTRKVVAPNSKPVNEDTRPGLGMPRSHDQPYYLPAQVLQLNFMQPAVPRRTFSFFRDLYLTFGSQK